MLEDPNFSYEQFEEWEKGENLVPIIELAQEESSLSDLPLDMEAEVKKVERDLLDLPPLPASDLLRFYDEWIKERDVKRSQKAAGRVLKDEIFNRCSSRDDLFAHFDAFSYLLKV